MAEIKRLVPGAQQKHPDPHEEEARIAALRKTVEHFLPEFKIAVQEEIDVICLHQDAFAAGYHDDEYVLLGMAVKYAGLHGKQLMFVGRNCDSMKGIR